MNTDKWLYHANSIIGAIQFRRARGVTTNIHAMRDDKGWSQEAEIVLDALLLQNVIRLEGDNLYLVPK